MRCWEKWPGRNSLYLDALIESFIVWVNASINKNSMGVTLRPEMQIVPGGHFWIYFNDNSNSHILLACRKITHTTNTKKNSKKMKRKKGEKNSAS